MTVKSAFNPQIVWALGLPLLLVALVYAPGFGGFWIGDDLTNLHHYFVWAQDGRLWSDSWARFFQGISVEGSAYRPLSILSLSANYALAGSHYAGWYASNYVVHLANSALIALLVLRLAAHNGLAGHLAAALAALLFGLAPTLAEGVYWLSARADGWVTLLTLGALFIWIGPPKRQPVAGAPLVDRNLRRQNALRVGIALCLLILGLGFKESAAVFPLQLTLLAFFWPSRLGAARWLILIGSYLLLMGFFVWRAHLFGHAFWVYATPGAEAVSIDWLGRLYAALLSLGPWWSALTAQANVLSAMYLLILPIAICLLIVSGRHRQRFIALALFGAGAGMALATVLNLGALLPHGEGGRLSYGPIAWFALGIGVLASGSLKRAQQGAVLALGVCVLAGAALLIEQLTRVWRAQDSLAALVAALPDYVNQNGGYTLLLVPETDGQVVMLRNGQGAMALPPLQEHGFLDRLLPSLPSDISERHLRIAGGMITQFEQRHFQHLTGAEVARLYDPAAPRWPDNYACWSKHERRIVPLAKPDPADAAAWAQTLRDALPGCGLAN